MNKNEAKVIIRNFIVRDRNFTIVQNHQGFYCAIEDKYINADGRINTVLNGFQMNASKDLDDCLTGTKNMVEIDYLVSKGHSKAEAFAILFNMMDKLPELEKAFA